MDNTVKGVEIDQVREQLIKLLGEAHSKSTEEACFENATYAKQLRTEANYLIANGVTVQEWIPVSNPPVPVGSYLISVKSYIDGKHIACEGYWDGEKWILLYTDKEITPRVTHWRQMPKPPKGD